MTRRLIFARRRTIAGQIEADLGGRRRGREPEQGLGDGGSLHDGLDDGEGSPLSGALRWTMAVFVGRVAETAGMNGSERLVGGDKMGLHVMRRGTRTRNESSNGSAHRSVRADAAGEKRAWVMFRGGRGGRDPRKIRAAQGN